MTGWALILTLLLCILIGYWAGWYDMRDSLIRKVKERLRERGKHE